MKAAVTIGNFDGVHRGHRSLIEAVTEWKRAQPDPHAIQSIVITFEPHPSEVLKVGHVVPRLSRADQKVHLLQNLGINEVKVIPFTEKFSQTSAREFFDQVLRRDLDLAFIAVGHNFFFGHDRGGTPEKLIEWCKELGVRAELVPPIESDGGPISSSRIRKLVQEGQMIPAARLLGRDFSLTDTVLHGDQRGRQLGFPTANLKPQTQGIGALCMPRNGVYLSSSTVDGCTFASITNVGVRPTVQSHLDLTVETHLLDFDGDLYGKQLTVEFRDRLRDEQKFADLGALTLQIQSDITIARQRLSLK